MDGENIVTTYKIGNTIVNIADDYCKTKQEVDRILQNISGIAAMYLLNKTGENDGINSINTKLCRIKYISG